MDLEKPLGDETNKVLASFLSKELGVSMERLFPCNDDASRSMFGIRQGPEYVQDGVGVLDSARTDGRFGVGNGATG